MSLVTAAIPTVATGLLAQSRGVAISLRETLLGSVPPAAAYTTVTFAPGLEADVYQPAARRNGAAIVVVHGGAWIGGGKGENVPWTAWLADRGYVVVDIQYRLAPNARWRDAVADIQTATRWVHEHAAELQVEPSRVALLGRSAGAHLSLLAAATTTDTDGVAAVVALYPPTDLVRLYASQNDELRAAMRAMTGGTPASRPEEYRAASPVNGVRPRLPPTLLIHGTWDDAVPLDQSVSLAGALSAANVTHDVLIVPWARHAFDIVFESPASQLAREVVDRFLSESL
jgi:acetyl esterase/lipase